MNQKRHEAEAEGIDRHQLEPPERTSSEQLGRSELELRELEVPLRCRIDADCPLRPRIGGSQLPGIVEYGSVGQMSFLVTYNLVQTLCANVAG